MFQSPSCTCMYLLFIRIPWVKTFWTRTWALMSLNGTPLQQSSVYHEHIPGSSKSDNPTYCIRLAAPWRAYQVKLETYGGTYIIMATILCHSQNNLSEECGFNTTHQTSVHRHVFAFSFLCIFKCNNFVAFQVTGILTFLLILYLLNVMYDALSYLKIWMLYSVFMKGMKAIWHSSVIILFQTTG